MESNNLDSKKSSQNMESSNADSKRLQNLDSKNTQNNTFCIMMPPPNVTGVLHIGHALTFTLQDIIVRYKRMCGFKTLWQPGLDHAGIATQNVVEKQLLAQGITKEELGREEFIKRVWEWKEESGGKILEQMRLLGFSPDFSRTRFTMDEGLANAVKHTFVSWYDKGLIYRGSRMINWCTHDGALSDIEVDYKENAGKLYYLRYMIVDSKNSRSEESQESIGIQNLDSKDSQMKVNTQSVVGGFGGLQGGIRGSDFAIQAPLVPPCERVDSINKELSKNIKESNDFVNSRSETKNVDNKKDSKDSIDSKNSQNLDSTNVQDSKNLSPTHHPINNIDSKTAHNKNYIIVATTRPETFFGDTAVMVNPNDERYKHLIGKKVKLPIINKEIPIIADEHVDMEFGTGAVKVTPAHDINDYEVGLRHNLEQIVIFDTKGILNEKCGEFAGLERLKARDSIVAKLQELHAIEKIEDYNNKVGTCYRCGNIIEPYISKQWFVKADIAKGAIERVNRGEAKFYPPQWINNYNAWMRDLRDWCISRQLWWGHRIPVFYCECGAEFASVESNPTCPKCNSQNLDFIESNSQDSKEIQNLDSKKDSKNLSPTHHPINIESKNKIHQDTDVLDTWFSSALWSHSTLGFANGEFGRGTLWQDSDLSEFHPNSLLITGFDILFFWVARMLIAADSNLHQIAFKDIYLHALVLDSKGQKMSKSKGNVIDPLALCRQYSPDIVRFSLAYLCVQGRDIRMSDKQLEITRNFTNKLANAMKFLQLYAGQQDSNYTFKERQNLNEYKTPLGIYMKSRLNLAITEAREALESYRFDSYASVVYRFLWSEFCDIGVEYAKADKVSVFELASVLIESMKMLHPLMPFISEFIFHSLLGRDIERGLGDFDSIMVEAFPADFSRDLGIEETFAILGDCITTIRRMRVNLELGGSELEQVYIVPLGDISQADTLHNNVSLQELGLKFIGKLAKVKRVFVRDTKPLDCVSDIGQFAQIFIESKNLDIDGLMKRLEAQKSKLEKEITKLDSMLSNENFIKNAPLSVVESNRTALTELRTKLNKITEQQTTLKN
nr:valine--tRNA ligase [Helicobacter saguini]